MLWTRFFQRVFWVKYGHTMTNRQRTLTPAKQRHCIFIYLTWRSILFLSLYKWRSTGSPFLFNYVTNSRMRRRPWVHDTLWRTRAYSSTVVYATWHKLHILYRYVKYVSFYCTQSGAFSVRRFNETNSVRLCPVRLSFSNPLVSSKRFLQPRRMREFVT